MTLKTATLRSASFLIGICAIFQTGLAAERPNVVLVMADDQGWGDMAYNGHPHVKTPHFDAMAQEAIRFDRFYAAAPVCSPTRGSVLTGRTPNRYGCFSWGHPIRPQEVTLAETLQAAGYRTGHFGKWHLGSVQSGSPVSPGASGFDAWASSPNFFDLNPILSVQGRATPFQGDSSDVTVDRSLEFIRANAAEKQPFLAVVWFGSPHSPHQALEEDRQLYNDRPAAERDFLGEITAMDRAFGRLRRELKELNINENTLLWYCSDNGALPKVGSSGGRRGAKGSIYEGGLLVPALLEWPARLKSPQTITAPCVTSDLYPTILDAIGVTAANQPPLDGISLIPILEGTTQDRSKPIGFWSYPAAGKRVPAKEWMEQLYEQQQKGTEPSDTTQLYTSASDIELKFPLDRFPGHAAWLDGNLKLHRIENPKTGKVTLELYDLDADPKESNDLKASQRATAKKMRQQLETWLTSVARSQNGEDYAQ